MDSVCDKKVDKIEKRFERRSVYTKVPLYCAHRPPLCGARYDEISKLHNALNAGNIGGARLSQDFNVDGKMPDRLVTP